MKPCCGFCGLCAPRYKRLADSVYPANVHDGLVRSNMEKLKFYVRSSPEKVDRIGEHFAQRIGSDLWRHKNDYVVIGMEAMDQLLLTCKAQSLNLFVESFLRVIQQLLETQEPQMQLLATHSFVKFANIEEDTPSYHRRYDFFVSKFSSLSHSNASDLSTRNMLRLAGINGLKGVVRKTVSDDLQVDIWDDTHMDKIVPSLLYNLQDREINPDLMATDSLSINSPSSTAEECLRELMGKVNFGNIRSVVKPVLKHFDNHQLWDAQYPKQFATSVFQTIMDSIHSQHSYAVVQLLMGHLDEKCKSRRKSLDSLQVKARVRTGIARVLSNIIAVAAAESIGPSVLEIISSLLKHLRNSIINFQEASENTEEEQKFQETVINALGNFADNLPDFQKIEIMIFIINKVPTTTANSKADFRLQEILLKCLLKVSTKYRTVNILHAFPSSFLNPLLSLSLASDPNVRLTVQLIFHQLLDRHNNLSKLSVPVSLSPLPPLTMEKPYRQDLMFMRKSGLEILSHIYKNVQLENNVTDNFNAIYTTLSLLCVEMNCEKALIDMLRLVFIIQDSTKNTTVSTSWKIAVHKIVAAFLHLISHLTAVPSFCTQVDLVIKTREAKAPWLLPEFNEFSENFSQILEESKEELLFDKETLAEALRSAGHDTSLLMTPLVSGTVVDSSKSLSTSDLKYIDVEVDSANSSPGFTRKQHIERTNFEELRKVLTNSLADEQDAREQRRAQITLRFKKANFSELVSKVEENHSPLQKQLHELFAKFSPTNENNCVVDSSAPKGRINGWNNEQVMSLSGREFPDIFVF